MFLRSWVLSPFICYNFMQIEAWTILDCGTRDQCYWTKRNSYLHSVCICYSLIFVNQLVTFIHKTWIFLDRNLHQKHGTPSSCHWGCSYSAKTQIKTLANYCERNKGLCQFISFNNAVFFKFLPPTNRPLFNFWKQIYYDLDEKRSHGDIIGC